MMRVAFYPLMFRTGSVVILVMVIAADKVLPITERKKAIVGDCGSKLRSGISLSPQII